MVPVPRPWFHFTPPSGWMNDPNGLVFHDGEYHLFYQYHPHSLVWGPMHWGHAVSRDLLVWEHLPIALEPDALGAIFSGSAVWDGNNTSGLVPGGGLVALFSYDMQAQGLAYSTDRGRTWTKYAANPVIPALAKDFRDPKVFWDGVRWSMVLAAGDHLEFYSSPNLREWTQTGRFGANLDVGVWECPDLFPLEGLAGVRWVLFLSVGDKAVNGGSGTLYWVGDWDGASFRPASGPVWLDGGTDNYAGVTWNGVPDRRLFIGWMNNWRYGRQIPARTWRGAMTVPRELSLDGPWLVQWPVEGLLVRRTNGHNLPGPVAEVSDAEMVLRATGPGPVTLSWSREELLLSLVWNPVSGTLTLDRSRAGAGFDPLWVETMTAQLKAPGPVLPLRVLLDQGSVEVFAEGGRTVMTAVFFPPPGGPWTVAALGAAVLEGTAWDLLEPPGLPSDLY